jgi:xylulokinase
VTCYLGIDSSTTATKALLVDADGEVLGVASSEYTCDTPCPMWTEQHPDLWWQATVSSIRQVLSESGVDPANVQGVGLTGQMHGLVLLDRDGAVLRPAILWNDQRPGAPDPVAQGLRAVQADGRVRHRQGRGCGHLAL